MANLPLYRRVRSSIAAWCLVTLVTSLPMGAFALPPHIDELLSTSNAVKVSDHVWAITGFPNVGIVVGRNTTLVVDTGLGRRNGATVAGYARQLAPHNRMFLTTTHYHPEHAAGVLGFPAQTVLIRNRVQQQQMDLFGEERLRFFANRTEQWKQLLTGEQLRAPDIVFDRELRLDLGGGVIARLLSVGAAHTKGDQVVFIEPDRTLISGDVVQNRVGPFIFKPEESGTAASWIAAVDQVAELGALHVVPDHSPIGDGSLVQKEKAFLVALRERALVLKSQGVSAQDAGRQLTAEFQRRYPDWTMSARDDLTSFVEAAYAER
jgi:glyoxylase-like metal-dependent hydrolase (beta-lactamase superfamily II)